MAKMFKLNTVLKIATCCTIIVFKRPLIEYVLGLNLCSDVAAACKLTLQLDELKHTDEDRCTHPLKFEQK